MSVGLGSQLELDSKSLALIGNTDLPLMVRRLHHLPMSQSTETSVPLVSLCKSWPYNPGLTILVRLGANKIVVRIFLHFIIFLCILGFCRFVSFCHSFVLTLGLKMFNVMELENNYTLY